VGKQYHFLAGLFRSGNTVLSAILNQNPDIFVSPISSLVEHMWTSHITTHSMQSSLTNNIDHARSKELTSTMIESYYKDVNKPIIFDRRKGWINPPNVDLIKEYVGNNSKIIFTTRSIIEIMASLINIMKPSLIDEMNTRPFIQDTSLSLDDNLADFLVSEHSNLGATIKWAFESIDNPYNHGLIHIVKYEDLTNRPDFTINKIYDFLNIKRFKHDFNNIEKLEDYSDNEIGLPKDLHNIRKQISKSSLKVEDVLTKRTIEKYKNTRYF